MKFRKTLVLSGLTLFLGLQSLKSQETKDFPFDPFIILKSWDYDFLVKTMGSGEEILGRMNNQTYLAGLRYPTELLGLHGNLDFSFNKDSILRIQFRTKHGIRVISADATEKKMRDPTLNPESRQAILKLDSLQRIDSLSRDSIVRAISEILGPPLSNGRTAVTEKNARYSAIWIKRGYSCLYKDYIDNSEIVFGLSTAPIKTIGEFDIPEGTEILQKSIVNTRKMSWTASLLGFPSNASGMVYSDVFLLLEYSTGQKYIASIPKNAVGYLQKLFLLEFPTRQRVLMSIPNNAICYLPTLTFEDCDGDAVPDAWLHVPCDINGSQTRHYLFSLQFREPNLIFSSDDLMPSGVNIRKGSQITVTYPDGTIRAMESPRPLVTASQTVQLNPKGFKYLNTTRLNTDGSTNFIGGIELPTPVGHPGTGILEITYKHSSGGWEADQINLLPQNR